MRRLIRRIQYAMRHRRLEAELAQELELHRELKQRDLETHGLPSTEAAFAASRAVGNVVLARDDARDVWIPPWLQDIAQDVRFGARMLSKDRRLTLSAIIALSLGIAANNTVFTFINAALFKDLPFDEPRQLVSLGTRDRRGRELQVSYLDFQDWRRETRAFSGIAGSTSSAMNLSDEHRAPERFRGSYISANAFDLLRVAPILGRGFVPDDERPGATPVAILGYVVWKSRYGGDPDVIGRTVRVNAAPAVVVGIMPEGFRFPMTAQVWQPLALAPGVTTAARDARTMSAFGRLRDSVIAEQARADLGTIAERLAQEYPDTNRGMTPTIGPPMAFARRFVRPMLMTLMGAVGFVLLIACVNVANLLLSRAAHRSREIAIRASLGATRWRIVRQLLIESLALATIAGLLGLLLSVYGVRYFGVAFDTMEVAAPDQAATPYWINLAMDGAVFAFVAALCLGCSVVFGLAPALHVSKTDVNDVLKEGGRSAAGSRRARRWTGALMIVELALTLVLLAGAGLLVRSFLTHNRTNLVIDTANLLTVRLAVPNQKYRTPEEQKAFLERLDERLANSTALAAVALASDIPFASLGRVSRQLSIDGRTPPVGEQPMSVSYVWAGPRYFDTLGLRLVQGRVFTARDGAAGAESAIVNQRFATMFFPNDQPLGRRIRLAMPNASGPPAPRAAPGDMAPANAVPWLTIVGVAPTLPSFGPPGSVEPPVVYVPARAETAPIRFVSVIARGSSAAAMTSVLREEVRTLDPDLPLYAVQTMDDAVARTRYPHRLMSMLFGLLAAIALVLASVGLYALTAHGVTQRTQEIGVRMALGAQAPHVVWLFVRRTLVQLTIGLALGLGGALATGRLLQAFLRGTDPRDPVTLACVTALLVVVSMAACVLPARRAARLEPVIALRHD